MSLVCPECERASFEIVDSVECGPHSGADESTIQRACCKECDVFFFCVYQSTRSFRSDRDDRVSHLAFATDQGLWANSADIFEEPSSRVSSEEKITAAMNVLKKAQETGVSGQHIAYAPVAMPPKSSPAEAAFVGKLFRALINWFRGRS